MSCFLRNYITYGRRISCVLNFNGYPIYINTRFKTVTMKYLNVAEKNDAAKNIALHLSRGTSRRREGLSQYNKIYEFEAEVMGQKSQMVMTSVSGHLLALEFVGMYSNWRSCNPLSLFEAQVFKHCPKDYEKIKQTLEREIRSCQGLIIWTDCDREGENIGYEIIEVCTAVKNNLAIYRAKFSEITSMSVQRALRNLEQPNKNISDAVDVRQELDLRIGAAFTRLQTLRLQKVFPTKLADKLLSYGSCQFPTLGFVVERYRAINNFVPEAFWKITVNHTINSLSVNFTWERGRLFDKLACQVLANIVLENPQAKVVKITTQPKSKWRPLPLDTVELEKLASRKLKINAKETMRLAEKLYTQGFISYPRTETNQFPKEMNLRSLVHLHTNDTNWGAFAKRILDDGGPTPRQGKKTDMAHPPIHPTKHTDTLSGNEFRLYEFIVRSFLACCSKDAQGQETTVVVDIANETFTANGLMITARNYLDVYPYDKWSSKEIHLYEMGQIFTPTKIEMVEGATSPPNLLTEADLIALMEKHGIGTDATHAEHIETIKSREYVSLANEHFVPGVLGMGLVEGYDAMGLAMARPHLRANLEADLKAISEGRKQPHVVLADQIAIYKEAFITVMEQANKIDNALGVLFNEQPSAYIPTTEALPVDMPAALKCPKCGTDMVVRRKKNNEEFYIGCMSFPNCRNSVWFPNVVKKVDVLPETCPTCGPNYHKIRFEWGNNSLSHLYPSPHVACIGGCDTSLLELLNIDLSRVKRTQSTVNNTTTHSSTNTSNRSNSVSSMTSSSVSQSSRNVPRNTRPMNNTNAQPRQNVTPIPRAQSSMNPIRMPAPNRPTNALPTPSDSGDNAVVCQCNKPAVQRTVRKNNHNNGRQFYKCPDGPENGGCDFFSWAQPSETLQNNFDTPSNSNSSWGNSSNFNSGSSNQQGYGAPTQGYRAPGQNDGGAVCNCGIPAKQITVRKEGPNNGRLFYACSKDYNSRCNFFEWADGGTNNNASDWGASESRGGARGRGARVRGAGGPRLCSVCRREGHTRNRCPERPQD
ncbi:DNA topoisomerase 3-alpha [Epargyreus clarus]|uniref:DNA topoisomerase 3-alpha n=1 Tax=Epargyreus clarus TaxID=520877 RepID=UPI003C30606C